MPNLLYILADQLRPQSCGYMGDNRARTPNIDRLSSEGINFVNATSVYPVCSPHRASLFTGCYPTTNGYVMNELGARTDLPTLAGTLTRNGVNCAYIGKWHIYATEGKVYKQAEIFTRIPPINSCPQARTDWDLTTIGQPTTSTTAITRDFITKTNLAHRHPCL